MATRGRDSDDSVTNFTCSTELTPFSRSVSSSSVTLQSPTHLLPVYVRVCTGDDPLLLPVIPHETVEHLCARAARLCGIGASACHLLALRDDESGAFVAAARAVSAAAPRRFSLLLRYRVPKPERLLRLDRRAFDYWFHQVRRAFLDGRIASGCRREDALGLAVTDMLRTMLELKVSRADVEKNYRAFLPHDLLKLGQFFVRAPLRRCLMQLLRKGIDNVDYVKLQYVLKALEMCPTYGQETFTACTEEAGRVLRVRLLVDPFCTQSPGVRCERSENCCVHVCCIGDLCYLSTRGENKLELARRNGIPLYFTFKSQIDLESFVSLLDGYYRLMEKWTFCLNRQLQSPMQVFLKRLRCHGPISQECAHRKLLEKRGYKTGCYLLRQHAQLFDHYLVDVCVENRQEPMVFDFCSNAGGFQWLLSGDGDSTTYSSLSALLCNHSVGGDDDGGSVMNGANDVDITFSECVPPSEHDDIPFELYADLWASGVCGSTVRRASVNTTSDQPRCIHPIALKLHTGRDAKLYGRYTVVQRASWTTGDGQIRPVVVKRLKQHLVHQHLQPFMDSVSACLWWRSDALVRTIGVCLPQAASLVMDWYPLGPLDQYLRVHRDRIKQVELVEASTYLAKALWYLDEHALTHGRVRCHNLLVAEHSEARLHVKLADTGLSLYTDDQIHWIPVEHYEQPEAACYSSAADVWAYGTTLWQVFSYGVTPLEAEDVTVVKQLYLQGGRLPPPDNCHWGVYQLMRECWTSDPHTRKTQQAIMRCINQILYEVFNARQVHTYASLSGSCTALVSPPPDPDASPDCSVIAASPTGAPSGEGRAGKGGGVEAASLSSSSWTLCSRSTNITVSGGAECESATAHDESLRGSLTSADIDLSPVSDGDLCHEQWWHRHADDKTTVQTAAEDRCVTVGKHKMLMPGLGVAVDTCVTTLSSLSHSRLAATDTDTDTRTLQLDQDQIQLEDTLGTGFYGVVYKAALTHPDGSCEIVAVKRLKKKAFASPAYHDLRREVSILKSLRHENVIRLLGVIEEPELMVVIEFAPLGSLLSYLRMYEDRLSTHQLLNFALDIARGMQYLGERSIIHRDLAARNVLVTDDCRMKISDFGLAHMTGSSAYYYLKTNRELPFRWYAPESIRYGKFSDQSDVWSFGITLHEMFTAGQDPRIPNCDDQQLLDTLDRGVRLCCPARCPVGIFITVMWPCWDETASLRPTFLELTQQLHELLLEY